MAINVNGIDTAIFNGINIVTQPLRKWLGDSFPDLALIILLGLSIAAGWWLNQKYPNLLQKWGTIWFVIMLYLLLRFV